MSADSRSVSHSKIRKIVAFVEETRTEMGRRSIRPREKLPQSR